jgi:hypothetical protein
MEVTIKRKQTRDTSFDNRKDDAMIRAIKEDHPEIKVKEVFDGHFFDQHGNEFSYDTSDDNGYSRKRFRELQQGNISEIRIDIKGFV